MLLLILFFRYYDFSIFDLNLMYYLHNTISVLFCSLIYKQNIPYESQDPCLPAGRKTWSLRQRRINVPLDAYPPLAESPKYLYSPPTEGWPAARDGVGFCGNKKIPTGINSILIKYCLFVKLNFSVLANGNIACD
jgi:hypothetical protein